MKYISKLVLLAAASLLPVSGVLAQTAATADIPFDFICQQKAMPHGSYRITVLNENAIAVVSKDGGIHAISLVESTDTAHGKGGKLVFHRYGDQYFLSEVQTPGRGRRHATAYVKIRETGSAQRSETSGKWNDACRHEVTWHRMWFSDGGRGLNASGLPFNDAGVRGIVGGALNRNYSNERKAALIVQ